MPTSAPAALSAAVTGLWKPELVPVVPLQFINANGSPAISNGWFTARLLGTTGSNAVVECSSDLVIWTSWQTNRLSVGGWDLAAPLGTNRQQFYRARRTLTPNQYLHACHEQNINSLRVGTGHAAAPVHNRCHSARSGSAVPGPIAHDRCLQPGRQQQCGGTGRSAGWIHFGRRLFHPAGGPIVHQPRPPRCQRQSRYRV